MKIIERINKWLAGLGTFLFSLGLILNIINDLYELFFEYGAASVTEYFNSIAPSWRLYIMLLGAGIFILSLIFSTVALAISKRKLTSGE
jgi:hypothetical protein